LISNGVLAGPKVHCVQKHNEEIKKVSKGVPRHYVNENLEMSAYGNCVEVVMVIRPLKFQNYTVSVGKNASSPVLYKVYVFLDGVKVLPHGH